MTSECTRSFKQRANSYAFQFFQVIRESASKKKNFLYSPAGLYSILGFLYTGSDGKTRDELAMALNIDRKESPGHISYKFKQLYCKYKHSDSIKFANKLFISMGCNIKSEALEKCKRCFICDAKNMDFRYKDLSAKAINEWIRKKTHCGIFDLIEANTIGEGNQILVVTVVTFQCRWLHPFNSTYTGYREFFLEDGKSQQVEAMFNNYLECRYGEFPELKCRAVDIAFMFEDLSMFIILPDEKYGIETLESKMANQDLRKMRKKMKDVHLSIYLPKFEIESRYKLKDLYDQMGAHEMFTDKADFSEIIAYRAKARVQQIYHKAFVTINEYGAGETEGPKKYLANQETEIHVDCNRPFIFAIVSDRHRILLLGCVRNPLTSKNRGYNL